MSFSGMVRLGELWRSTIAALSTRPQTLDPHRAALLVVDVQPQFASAARALGGNHYTEIVSDRIAALAPLFRRAGVRVYAIYFRLDPPQPRDGIFYKFHPQPQDRIIEKATPSAFNGVDVQSGISLKAALERDQRDILLVCGFKIEACVKDTITDARGQAYRRFLLHDLSGDGLSKNPYATGRPDDLEAIRTSGASIITAEKALRALSRNGPSV